MIISHTHKYLFVEVPRTGSTAISAELIEHYGGEPILFKHAYYSTFCRHASEEEKTYRVISGIRNPLDDAVSIYRKYSTKDRSYYSGNRRNIRKYEKIRNDNLTFSQYLRQFHHLPYDHWASTFQRRCAHVIRFENLQNDFANVLKQLGIEQVRDLPRKNKTDRKSEFVSYYQPSDIPFVARIFGPYLREWQYRFPRSWGNVTVPYSSIFLFKLLRIPRQIYWNSIRQNENLLGRTFRKTILDE